jgi:hypothetical protein
MRTKITIIFETHGLGTIQQLNEWNEELLEVVAKALELAEETEEGKEDQYPLVTFDIVSIEKLAEEPEL